MLLSGNAFLGKANAITDTPYTFTIPAGINDGSYGAVAVDTFNNVSGYHVTGLTIDNTAPIVTIGTANGQTVNTTSFLVSGSTEPLLGVTIATGSGSTNVTAIGNGSFSGIVTLAPNTNNTVTVSATDVAGNVGFNTINVIEDDINPLFTITPSATITNQASVTFSGSTDANVNVNIVGGLAPVNVTSNGSGSFSGTLTLNMNVLNTLNVTTTDLGNNSSTGSFTVLQDNILPTVTISTASGSIVDSATFQIDGTTEMNATVSVTNQSGSIVGTVAADNVGAFSVNATLVQDSNNVLTVTATDAAGNQSSGSVSVLEDSVANTLLIDTLPAATNAANITVSGTTKTNSNLILTHSGGLTQTGITANGTYSFSVPLIANSLNSIDLSSQDQAGHVATGSLNIIHDTIVPVVMIGTPSLTTSLTSYTITGSTEPLASIVISGGSGANVGGVASASGAYSISVPLQIGIVNTLTVTASDLAGNSGSGNVLITQDPIPLTLVLNPLGTTITNAMTITVSGTSKANANIAITGSGSANTTASGTGAFASSVTLVANGVNAFTVTASDAAGAVLSSSFSVTQDSIAPSLALANSTGATALLSYTVVGTTESGATVQATVTGTGAFTGAINSVGSASGSFTMAIPLLANTGATFTLVATDTAGNSSTGAILTVLQDNLAPAISAQTFSGTTTNSVTTGTYQFTTNETTNSTFYVGTGSNVLATLIWSGSTLGTSHSGAIVGIQPNVSYSTFVRAIDLMGNMTDSPVAPVTFLTTTTVPETTGGSFVSSGGGGGGGGSITIGVNGLVNNNTSTTLTGTVTSPVTPPNSTQSGTVVIKTSTGTTTKTLTGTTVTKQPLPTVQKPTKTQKPATIQKPGATQKPASVPTNTTSPGKGTVVEGPGFGYAIVDKNYVPPTGANNGKDEISAFTPGVRFISASNSVRVRGTRNVQSYLVEILPRNSRVLLVQEKDGWGKIEVHGTIGWVKLDYLRSLQDSDLARSDARLFEL